MKSILTVIFSFVFLVSGFSQTRNVVVGTNDVIVQPTNFWSANASNGRAGLGLGSAATNPASAFQPASTVLSNLASSNGASLTNIAVSNVVGALATNGNAANLTNFPSSLLRTNGSASGLTNFPSSVLLTNGNGFGLTNLNASNITGIIPASNISTLNLTNIGGTLAIASGGTGATNAGGARTNLGLGSTNNVTFNSINTELLNYGTNYIISLVNQEIYDIGGQSIFGWTSNSIEFGSTNIAAATRTNLGLGWPALTNSNAGTGLVSVNTNGEVVSPTNFWQAAPIQTVVQNLAPITNSTNAATNARNLYVYSLATNITGVTNTVTLPTNTSTFAGDSATITHQGPTSSVTAVRQAGAGSNLITINRFDESIKFIYENNSWTTYHNISFQEPIYFSGTNATANAATSRTNLGLGATNAVTFREVGTDAFRSYSNITEFYKPIWIGDSGTNDIFQFELGATDQAKARTNLGLGFSALTNTNAAGFQRAIFTTNAAPTNAGNFGDHAAWMGVSIVTNGVTNTFLIPLYK